MKYLNLSNFWRITILLIVFIGVLGATSLSYCYQYKLTENDCDILIDYFFGTGNQYQDQIKTYFKAQIEHCNQNYDIVFLSFYDRTHPTYRLYGLNREQITSYTNLNNLNYMSITFTGIAYERSATYNGRNYGNQYYQGSPSNATIPLATGAQLNTRYLIYTNDFLDVEGPYQSGTLLEFSPPVSFNIILNTDNNTKYFNITTDTGNDILNIPVLNSFNFGTLNDNTYIYYIHDLLGFWYWTGSNWTYKTIYNRNKDMVILKNNNYMSFNYFNDYEQANLYINDIVQYKNVIYHYQITNAQFDSIDSYFLVGNNNTIISNNSIDTNNFGNDYLNQFNGLDNIINNNDNTTEIIDSITNIDNIDNTIDSYLSGDINSWSNDLGYSPLENPFSAFLFELVENVYTSLTVRQDVSLDFNHHNTTNWVINSRDFITPNSPVKNLITWCLVFLWIYGNYKYYHYLITIIQTAKIDKAIAEFGTDEFYDSDIM